MGFNEFMTKLFGNKSQRDLKEITPYVDKIKAVYPSIQKLSNDELRAKTDEIKQRIQDYVADERKQVEDLRKGIDDKELEEREAIWAEVDKIEKAITDKMEVVLEESLPEVFSIMKETARRFTENEEVVVTATDFDRDLATKHDFVRIEGDKAIFLNHWKAGGNEITWDMVHYDVQLFGGVVLHKGKIAEMATGEGKTLVATLPVFLNALTRNGVHVVTVNDYLSKRDSEWMGPLYMFHGLSVDCIDKHQPNSDARRAAYNADITFGTNNEFGFDYLRDNMAISPNDLVQRKHNYAIVDEVDSVLIDDARTPLIISGPIPRGEEQLFFTAGDRAGNDQRCTGIVDQYGVDLIDNGIVVLALNQVVRADRHIVTQVVETEFVVGSECDIAIISSLAGCTVRFVLVNAIHRKAMEHI